MRLPPRAGSYSSTATWPGPARSVPSRTLPRRAWPLCCSHRQRPLPIRTGRPPSKVRSGPDFFPRPETPRDIAVLVQLERSLHPIEIVLPSLTHVDGQAEPPPDLDEAVDARAVGRGPVLVERQH